jgi:hypothetical protein
MTGGLIQLVSSGREDSYLTVKPQITFFKKVYRRHTNFSMELIEVNSESTSQYNNISSFIIKNGDAINKCYLEITLPKLSFPDTYITNPEYLKRKTSNLNNLQLKYTKWYNFYINLAGYVKFEVDLYRILYNFLQTKKSVIGHGKTTMDNHVMRYDKLQCKPIFSKEQFLIQSQWCILSRHDPLEIQTRTK